MTANLHGISEVETHDWRGRDSSALSVTVKDSGNNGVSLFFDTKAEARDFAVKLLSVVLQLPDDVKQEDE